MCHTLQNPNVVGSGYIQHPAQKPFAATLQMQPPTVAVSRNAIDCLAPRILLVHASHNISIHRPPGPYSGPFGAPFHLRSWLPAYTWCHKVMQRGSDPCCVLSLQHFEFPDEYSTYREHTRHPAGGQAPPRRSHDQRSQVLVLPHGEDKRPVEGCIWISCIPSLLSC